MLYCTRNVPLIRNDLTICGCKKVKRKRNVSVARKRVILAVVALLCVIVGVVVLLDPRMRLSSETTHSQPGTPKPDPAPTRPTAHWEADKSKENPPPAPPPPDPGPAMEWRNSITDEDLDYLVSRNLLIPVASKTASDLRDNFNQGRSEGRQHNALDIMAPQGTPILATADGSVTKLFQSEKGGITLYQLDTSGRYVYYYAHLMGYAEGIAEGKQLRRGDLIAYVGDTGNAGVGNYHLHFAISKVSTPRQWSGGDPINPYPFLVGAVGGRQ